jgi:hypothetical protein
MQHEPWRSIVVMPHRGRPVTPVAAIFTANLVACEAGLDLHPLGIVRPGPEIDPESPVGKSLIAVCTPYYGLN